ncbi:hypothetical protein SAMN02745724_05093 [Pseudoalteromonas denitrificans DSM 6059]|uniref:Uncharacterized protein n=2 Tax=Pseudoalteromonas TaxID=53246 RepID=A0A1I1U8P2_9GAMM|nr:hypothetical protein SAMN02745724_05093 [Pseudoalteromonas denitrificans DSM 6059]
MGLLSVNAISGTKIDKLEVKEQLAVFTTLEQKLITGAGCMASTNINKWALNLTCQQGRDFYSLLLVAISSSAKVSISSENDCEGTDNYEIVGSMTWFNGFDYPS